MRPPDSARSADDPDREESLTEAFHAVSHLLRQTSMSSLARWEVTPSQSRALVTIARAGDGLRLSELSGFLRIAPRSTTEVVDDLEAKGLVGRRADPDDRRATRVSLTRRASASSTRSGPRGAWSRNVSSTPLPPPTARISPGSSASSGPPSHRPRDADPMRRLNQPPGWPTAPPGWAPQPGWHPDPSWPAPPPGWELWVERRRTWIGWFVASGSCVPLALVALLLGLGSTTLALVYASIVLSLATVPLAALGRSLVRDRQHG